MTTSSCDAPYASIILPIIDRADTLKVAIPQACRQNRRDIELIIACSGATKEVLRIARQAAERDARIKVMDLPPSRVSTAQARAAALRAARSDRILILQDDDIWLPDQVDVLGGLLDDADVAIGPTLALDLSGRGVAWLCNFASPSYRALFLAGAPKMVFEAHYAFRRSAYDRIGIDWAGLSAGGCSRHVLAGMASAGDAIRWAVTPRASAVSLNSPVRVHMSQAQRASEISARLESLNAPKAGSRLLRDATFLPVLEIHLRAVPPAATEDLPGYLARLGLALPGDTSSSEDVAVLPVTPDQAADLQRLFDLFQGRKVDRDALLPIIADLMVPFAGHEPRLSVIQTILPDIYGAEERLGLIDAATTRETDTYRKALLAIARAAACLGMGHTAQAIAAWRQAENTHRRAAASATLLGARIAVAEGDPDRAVKDLAATISRGHGHVGHDRLLTRLQASLHSKL